MFVIFDVWIYFVFIKTLTDGTGFIIAYQYLEIYLKG